MYFSIPVCLLVFRATYSPTSLGGPEISAEDVEHAR